MKPYRRPCPPSSSNGGGHPKAKFAVPRRNKTVTDEVITASTSPSVSNLSNDSELGATESAVTPPVPVSPPARNSSPSRSTSNSEKFIHQHEAPSTPLSPLDQNRLSMSSIIDTVAKKNDEPPPTPLSPLALNESHLSSETGEPPPAGSTKSARPRDSPTSSVRLLAFDDTLDETKVETAINCIKGSIIPFDDKVKSCVTTIIPVDYTKCTVAYLGGSDAVLGLPALGARKSCARLRCASCDLAVVRIAGKRWKADLTYLFLRNSMPSLEKIASMLEPDATAASYACQCSWKVVTRTVKLTFNGTPSDCGKLLQWSCTGHPP